MLALGTGLILIFVPANVYCLWRLWLGLQKEWPAEPAEYNPRAPELYKVLRVRHLRVVK